MTSDTDQLNRTALLQLGDFVSSFSPMYSQATSMEAMSDAIVNHIYRTLRDSDTGQHQCALVRLFRSCTVDQLPAGSRQTLPITTRGRDRALVLLASRGQNLLWNSRHTSQGHQAILLNKPNFDTETPMIASLIKLMGLDLLSLGNNDFQPANRPGGSLNLFYVEDALSSPLIPAKDDFVRPYDIKSVVGFGSLLDQTDLFTVVMFFNVRVTADMASEFNKMARAVCDLLKPFHDSKKIFNDF